MENNNRTIYSINSKKIIRNFGTEGNMAKGANLSMRDSWVAVGQRLQAIVNENGKNTISELLFQRGNQENSKVSGRQYWKIKKIKKILVGAVLEVALVLKKKRSQKK